MTSATTRFFAITGSTAAHAEPFRVFLLFEATIHAWFIALKDQQGEFATLLMASAVMLLPGLVALRFRRFLRVALAVALLSALLRIVIGFPNAHNHLYLECLALGAAVLLRPDDEGEDATLVQFVAWTAVIVLFWTGLQKALHGCYFRGEFLAVSMAANDEFAVPLAAFFSEEVASLRQHFPIGFGSGPFRIDSPWFAAVSNSVWIAEMVAPLLLIVHRTRPLGLIVSTLLIVGIEIMALELIFGVIFVGMLWLFAPSRFYRRAVPVLMAGLAVTLAIKILLPDVRLN